MKFYSKFLSIAILGGMVACNNAPEEAIEASEAKEVAEEVATAETYSVLTDGDEITWIGFKTYADDSHTGTIQVEEGEFQTEGGNIISGKFVINMSSINSTDMPAESEYKAKLEGHLKSPDFFAVEEYPTAAFALTSVSAVDESDTTGATHILSGNLSMRDKEKNISIPAMLSFENDEIIIKTPEFVIDRTNWDVNFRSTASIEAIAKENAIDDNIKLRVNLRAKKS
tara:strand:- start:3465 stop:4145 length:681 start_codon:yes stop_codon:yes gene_type:complete